MTSFFKQLFEYSHHFNQQLATIFTVQSALTSEKSVKLFNHILNAQHIWNSRINKKPQLFAVWDMHPVHALTGIDNDNYGTSIKLLDDTDLENLVTYTTSRGDVYTNSVKDILFHVINHSTYHRGQIAMEFKQIGIEPLITDYVFYRR